MLAVNGLAMLAVNGLAMLAVKGLAMLAVRGSLRAPSGTHGVGPKKTLSPIHPYKPPIKGSPSKPGRHSERSPKGGVEESMLPEGHTAGHRAVTFPHNARERATPGKNADMLQSTTRMAHRPDTNGDVPPQRIRTTATREECRHAPIGHPMRRRTRTGTFPHNACDRTTPGKNAARPSHHPNTHTPTQERRPSKFITSQIIFSLN